MYSRVCHCQTVRPYSSPSVTFPNPRRATLTASSRDMPLATSSSTFCSRRSLISWERSLKSRRRVKSLLIQSMPCSSFCRGEHTRDSFQHALKARYLAFHVLAALACKLVGPHAALGCRYAPFGLHPAFFEHSLQRRVKRALFHLEQVIRCLLDMLRQGIAVQGFSFQRLENHHLQSAGKEAAFVLLFHDPNPNKVLYE